MQDLISSYLIQAKDCNLPGVGNFRITTTPASLDVADKKMFPPTDEIVYTERTDKISDELINYIAHKKNIEQAEAKEQIKNWCRNIKEKLHIGEEINFASIGSLQKIPSGSISFQKQEYFSFFEPVTADRIIHKDAEHAVLVGDRETTSSAMNQYLQEDQEIKNSSWKIAAIVLLIIALSLLFFHFYSGSSTNNPTGNHTGFYPDAPAATYISK